MTEDPASDSHNDSSAPKTASPSQDRQQLVHIILKLLFILEPVTLKGNTLSIKT